MKIKEVLINGIKALNENGIEEANLKARLLLEHELGVSQQYLIVNTNAEIDEGMKVKYEENLNRIINGMPVQYITNNQCFYGLDFYVDESVLIPQPDTEILVERVIKLSKELGNNVEILDLCTGSGAIAIALATQLKTKVWASDIKEDALSIAQKNATINHADVEFIKSDLFENIHKKYNIIVSNPPYIQSDIIDKLSKEVQNEPRIALDGGKDGLDFYRTISLKSKEFLKEDGILALEIGYNQKDAVIKILKFEGFAEIEAQKDYSHNDRIIIARLKGEKNVIFV